MKKLVKRLGLATLVLSLCMGLVACGGEEQAKEEESTSGKETIKIGTFPSTDQIPNVLKESLADKYDVEIIMFDGNNMPAEALSAGDLDGIVGNGDKWLEIYNKENNTDMVMVDPYYSHFAGLYTEKYDSVDEFPQDATIAIANDPTNVNNALKLLRNAGLIELSDEPGEGDLYTKLDITKNDKNLQFSQMDLTVIAQNLGDVDGAVTSAILIREAGGDPMSFLALPNQEDLQKTGLIVRSEDKDKQWVKDAVEASRTDESAKKIKEALGGTAIMLDEIDEFYAKVDK